jgi:stage III sporulation protein AE
VFKDSADTLIGCALIMKSALGTVGSIGLGSMLLAPCVQLICVMFSWRICAAVLEPFGNRRVCSMLCGFADVVQSLLLLVLGTGALCLIVLSAGIGTGMRFV